MCDSAMFVVESCSGQGCMHIQHYSASSYSAPSYSDPYSVAKVHVHWYCKAWGGEEETNWIIHP